MEAERFHSPVLLNQVLSFLLTQANGTVCDCTVGDGGHSLAILEATSPRGKLIGIDRDGEAIERAKKRLGGFGERVTLVQEEFGNLDAVLRSLGSPRVTGFLFDLGASWSQIEDRERGFSYQRDGPLDMRMDKRKGRSALQLVNELPGLELSQMISAYGEERRAKTIADLICASRERRKIRTTGELSLLIRRAVPRRRALKALSRTFQALRIAVNDELSQLERGLERALRLLPTGGRTLVISYHSLEDRIVKQMFKKREAEGRIRILTKKVVKPSREEIRGNLRARSARLRVAQRV